MKKISLEKFKKEFMDESKEKLLEELTGGILGQCHCMEGTNHDHPDHCGTQ